MTSGYSAAHVELFQEQRMQTIQNKTKNIFFKVASLLKKSL